MNRPKSLLVGMGVVGASLLMGATLTFYEESLPSTMNPLFAKTMVDRRAHELMFDRIYYRSAVTMTIKSRVVRSEQVLDDGASIALTLVEGIKWHDGEPLTAEDICFTVDAMLNPATPSEYAKPFREVLSSCEADKKSNIATIHFVKAYHNPKERLAFPILPRHVFGGNTAITGQEEFSLRPVGSGPMRGVKGRREVKFTAVPNAHHNARIPVASLSEGGDPFVQVRTLLNGGVHGLITVAPPLRPDIAASDDVALKSYDLRSWWFIALNTRRGSLANTKVRQALDVSLDRSQLRELTMGVDPNDPIPPCQFISGPFVQSSPYYNRGISYHERSDKARVRALMGEAGGVEQGGRWTVGGKPVSFRIGMNAPLDLEARDLLNQVGNQLQEAGFGREVYKVKADDWNTKAVTGKLGEYDMLIGKWSFGLVEDVGPLFHTRSGGRGALNIFNYDDAETNRLLDAWDAATTDTAAQDAYHELHKHLSTDLPYLFLWKLDTKSAWRMEVRGNTIAPYYYFSEFTNWTLD